MRRRFSFDFKIISQVLSFVKRFFYFFKKDFTALKICVKIIFYAADIRFLCDISQNDVKIFELSKKYIANKQIECYNSIVDLLLLSLTLMKK